MLAISEVLWSFWWGSAREKTYYGVAGVLSRQLYYQGKHCAMYHLTFPPICSLLYLSIILCHCPLDSMPSHCAQPSWHSVASSLWFRIVLIPGSTGQIKRFTEVKHIILFLNKYQMLCQALVYIHVVNILLLDIIYD